MFELLNRKVRKGAFDTFKYKMEYKHTSALGIVHRHPIDITGWEFTLFVHEKPVLTEDTIMFAVKGETLHCGSNVLFKVSQCMTDVKPGTYWYSIRYKKPSGMIDWIDGAKYVIVETLHPYFDIYPDKVDHKNYATMRPKDYLPEAYTEDTQL